MDDHNQFSLNLYENLNTEQSPNGLSRRSERLVVGWRQAPSDIELRLIKYTQRSKKYTYQVFASKAQAP